MKTSIAIPTPRRIIVCAALLMSLAPVFSAPAHAAIAEVPKGAAVTVSAQAELRRVGCYQMRVDGVWGQGSRAALQKYYKAKQISAKSLVPTKQLLSKLRNESSAVCGTGGKIAAKGKLQPTKISAEKQLRLRKSLLNSGSF